MNANRIEQIQKDTPYPDSVAVASALMKVWNECGQEQEAESAQLRKALKAAQHDLITTTGLYCTDIVQDGVKLPEGFQLEHASLALIEKALKA